MSEVDDNSYVAAAGGSSAGSDVVVVDCIPASVLNALVNKRMIAAYSELRNSLWSSMSKATGRDFEFCLEPNVSNEFALRLVKELRDNGYRAKAFDRHGNPIGPSMFTRDGCLTTLCFTVREIYNDVSRPVPRPKKTVAPQPVNTEEVVSLSKNSGGSPDVDQEDRGNSRRRTGCITIHVPTGEEATRSVGIESFGLDPISPASLWTMLTWRNLIKAYLFLFAIKMLGFW